MTGEARQPDGFAALTAEQQDAILQDLERGNPAFFEVLVRQTYSGYYSRPEVLRLLGVEGPPQPGGHRVDPFDPGLVGRVRRSAFTYRQP
jgi:hypothetical protein